MLCCGVLCVVVCVVVCCGVLWCVVVCCGVLWCVVVLLLCGLRLPLRESWLVTPAVCPRLFEFLTKLKFGTLRSQKKLFVVVQELSREKCILITVLLNSKKSSAKSCGCYGFYSFRTNLHHISSVIIFVHMEFHPNSIDSPSIPDISAYSSDCWKQ